jgi:hypothetical protein
MLRVLESQLTSLYKGENTSMADHVDKYSQLISAESLTEVENRDSISPYSNYQHRPARRRSGGVPPDLCMTGRMPVNECRW